MCVELLAIDMKIFFVLFVGLLWSQMSLARAPCADYSQMVDGALKEIAVVRSEGVTDNSAPRETNRQLKIANYLSEISVNIDLMRTLGCVKDVEPVYMGKYLPNAILCSAAKLKKMNDVSESLGVGERLKRLQEYELGKGIEECDSSKWKVIPEK